MVYIYTLSDPNTNEIRYVGKTNNLKRRMYLHIAESKTSKTHKAHWVKSILEQGKKPIIEILDVVDDNGWKMWESYWISQLKTWGFSLCNLTDGGDGVPVWTEEMRIRMAMIKSGCTVWNKGIPMSNETKEKVSKSKLGCKSAFKGKTHTDEFKQNKSKQMIEYFKSNSSNFLGKKHTNESKNLMSINARVNKLQQKSVIQFNVDEQPIKDWHSVVDAGTALNIVPSNIRKMCKSGEFYRLVGGFKWKYKENYYE